MSRRAVTSGPPRVAPSLAAIALALTALAAETSCAAGSAGGTADATAVLRASAGASTGTGSRNPGVATFDATVVEVVITGADVQTADERVIVALNSLVRLIVTSDVPGDVHVHGVDEHLRLLPGETVTLDFVASIPGIFEVEGHGDIGPLFSLQVQP